MGESRLRALTAVATFTASGGSADYVRQGQGGTLPRMIELTPDESRVLGVLVEKAQTTPDQYPLSLNAVVNGCNQKNNREPVLTLDEGRVFDALEGLRGKGLVVRSDMAGSRVNKYRHQANDALRVRMGELAVLAELLLRGPQTLGELRGRASRMHPLESLDDVKQMLRALSERSEPLARELPPSPGSRAERYAQLLCPDLHGIEAREAPASQDEPRQAQGSSPGSQPALAIRVEKLEDEVARLKSALRQLAEAMGVPDPMGAS